jgi:hypothetical protein
MGQFLEKIFFKKISTMGFGNQPTIISSLIMGGAEDIVAG